MAKRKKFPRLPNGYGSIRYLGKGRKRPFAVHPPADRDNCTEKGNPIRPPALCYTDDWYIGFAVLNAYHAGTYQPGDELRFRPGQIGGTDMEGLCRRILSDYASQQYVKTEKAGDWRTFADVYRQFYRWKFQEGEKKLSKQSEVSTQAAYKNCAALHGKIFRDLRLKDLQECVNDCPLKKASVELMISLLKQMYRYAMIYDLCDRNYTEGLRMPDKEDDEHGEPFTDQDLRILWRQQDDPTAEMILIMVYSGFRISAYLDLEVNLKDWYFKGGVKTAAGKDRIVPIHTAIRPLVERRMEKYGRLLPCSKTAFRDRMKKKLSKLGILPHTPHDCRHTFSALCERYRVNDNDRKRLLGHSFGSDITNSIYGHRTLEELREQVEKIQIPDL